MLPPMAIASAAGVARLIGRLPGGMTLERGEQIHDFVRARRPSSCLELGTANGVGALSIGSALEANGFGTLTASISGGVPKTGARKLAIWSMRQV